ncbi:hypothetical protein [Brevibacillus sp. VP]|uniref:hypothetical protein n=1 Tax=unclassified Brevibacillus TaxID=2684853 RepID=UPI000E2FA45D|nr:hypothetical protein [Brevibacillus sp. VP]RFB35443.1 hypothetical protein DZB91_08010 [Brevibacillus sp. VP]
MDELYVEILKYINGDLFEVTKKEDVIVITSKENGKEYIVEYEDIPEEKINLLLDILATIDTLEFLDVDIIEDTRLITKAREKDEFKFLLDCCFSFDFEASTFEKLTFIKQIVNLVVENLDVYKDLQLKFNEEELTLEASDWRAGVSFNTDNIEDTLYKFKSFFEGTYIESTAFYEKDYIEFSITFPELENIFGMPSLSETEFLDESNEDKLYFEINKISEPFFNLMMKDQEYGDEYGYDGYEEVTLKIYNINSELQIELNADDFYEKALHVTKNIIFNLSYKYEIDIKLSNELEGENIDDLIYELSERLESIQEKDMLVTKLYDKDLVNYYYRALQMKDSEFKYMAFYQVLECIYDEVLMANTVESIRQLISSNGFDSNMDENILFIIEKIKLHNSSKKDEDKLKLILDKYFKGTLPDEVFLEVNKDIAELMVDMKKIRDVSELKDLQKLQQTIYRFRCDCTHSNRAYPIKRVEDENSLSDYINLIKMVSERIILNYR